jgi:hypothetical protein
MIRLRSAALLLAVLAQAQQSVSASAQTGTAKPLLIVAPTILAEPGADTPLAIDVRPPEAVPRNSFVRIRGLPPEARLSDGHVVTAGTWAVPIVGLAGLTLSAPGARTGRSELNITLVTIDGAALAEARVTLLIAAASLIAPPTPGSAANALIQTAPATPPPHPDTVHIIPSPAPRPPAASAAPPAPPAAASAEARERASRLLKRGDGEMAAGDVAAARLYYQRAAEAGLADAAMAMAATFDPHELARRPVRGLQPDPASARQWYERAQHLGAAGAGEALRRLGGR